MALNGKYAALPDLVWDIISTNIGGAQLTYCLQDSAPDIYETPELTDDNSTVPVCILLLQFQQTLSIYRLEGHVQNQLPRPTKISTRTTMNLASLGEDYNLTKLDHTSYQHK